MNHLTPPLRSPLLKQGVEAGILDAATARRLDTLRDPSVSSPAVQEDGSAYRPLLLGLTPPSTMTLNNLFPFAINRKILRVVKTLGENTDYECQWLFVHGSSGVGKTHLLSACAHLAAARKPLMVSLSDLGAELERAQRVGCSAELRQQLASVDFLILDDVHLARGDTSLQRVLLALLDHRLALGRTTIFGSLLPPDRLKDFEPQLRSRLGAGAVMGLVVGEHEERLELLRRLAPDGALSDQVMVYVAEQICDSVRRLKAAVLQLLTAGEGASEPITPEIARALIPRPEDVRPRSSVRPSETQEAASPSRAGRYKEMVAAAETEDEQILALQIAIGDRLRQLHEEGDEASLGRLQVAQELLREGDAEGAIASLASSVMSATEIP